MGEMPDDELGEDALDDDEDGAGGGWYEPPIELGMRRLVAMLDARCTPTSGSGENKRWTCVLPQHEGAEPSVYVSTVDTVVWVDLSALGERGAQWGCESCLIGGPVSSLAAWLWGVEVEEAEMRLARQLAEERNLAHRFGSDEQARLAREYRSANVELWNPALRD